MRYKHLICFVVSLLCFITAQGRVHNLRNKLSLKGINVFPDGSFEHIVVLDMWDSNLSKLEANIFYNRKFYDLKKAFLRNNNIAVIEPDAFEKMAKIKQLDLYGNNLTTFHKRSFNGLDSLEDLHLGSNKITDINEAVLEPLRSLKTLDLSGNLITKLNIAFVKWTGITNLNLGNNPLMFRDNGPILESYTLTSLNLESCDIENLSFDAFSMIPQLQHLDLSGSKLKVLPEGLLKGQGTLKYLDISSTSIACDIHISIDLEQFYCDENSSMENKDDEKPPTGNLTNSTPGLYDKEIKVNISSPLSNAQVETGFRGNGSLPGITSRVKESGSGLATIENNKSAQWNATDSLVSTSQKNDGILTIEGTPPLLSPVSDGESVKHQFYIIPVLVCFGVVLFVCIISAICYLMQWYGKGKINTRYSSVPTV